jgi:hypothetical protein
VLKEREGGSRSTTALKSKPKERLQPVEEKIKWRIFFTRKIIFSSPIANSLKPFQERPAPVLALQCLALELGCASPPL